MKSNTYLPALTGIRAIAAFMVFFHHFNQAEFPFFVFRTLNEFHTGVTLFFVLSGFLICFRYYDTLTITGFSKEWFLKYFKNRVARIYPMYAILTIATFVFAWSNGTIASISNGFGNSTILLLMNLFFVRGFFDNLKFTGVSQGWSLTVEECFYLLAPVFFVQIKKNIKAIWVLPLGIILASVGLVMVCSHIDFFGFYGNFTFLFLYTFTGRCVEFFIGICLGLIIIKKDDTISKLPIITSLGFVVIAIAIAIMTAIPLTETRHFGLYHPLGILSNNVFLPIGISMLYYGLIKESSWIRKLLSTPLMGLLGKSSYIFYLIHIGFISNSINKLSQSWVENLSNWCEQKEYGWFSTYINTTLLNIGILFIILNLIAILLYSFIEEPLNLYIRKTGFIIKSKTSR